MPERPPDDRPHHTLPAWDLDVTAELRKLRDQQADDTPRATMLRVLWLRHLVRDARISTKLEQFDDAVAIVRARVEIPDGASSSGIAAEQVGDHATPAAAVELAETRAIGRALDVLGLVLPPAAASVPKTQPEAVRNREPAPERSREAEPPPMPTPVPSRSQPAAVVEPDEPLPPVVDALRRAGRTQPAGSPPPRAIRPVETPEDVVPTEPVPVRSQPPEVRFTVPTPFPQRQVREPGADDGDDEAPLEDVSWTAFWRWAKARGLDTKAQIAEKAGRSVDGMNPGEIRIALRDAGVPLDSRE
jgi:hypothetical protein